MTENQDMEKRLVALEKQLHLLLDYLTKKEDKTQELHYHIKHLEIKEAHIDKFNYHLDNIDIEQLSGTLNIGNNFENPSHRPKGQMDSLKKLIHEKQIKKSKPTKITSTDKDGITLTEQKRGYTITFDTRGKRK
ncbi:spore germination protein GerPC [Bacillus sp. THAF10]|uniref:spore germination protein GerPC n=1 Tax=Bacillus sp. THAF10 TaxID=2587848 RepID=UPI001562292D|nr:spore germination protein GerPC [Bacillus sp. THAF10]